MNSELSKAANWLKKYHRVANYISTAMLYLKENFLLEDELSQEHIKNRILGHWGTVPGLNLIYGGINHLIKETNQNTTLIVGPGHGAPAVLSGLWLEGTLSEYYPEAKLDYEGLGYLIKQFSWPEGFPSHTYPGLPGSIHEGGELGYSLGTAFGTILDNSDLLTVCVVGDGEAETGPLAAAWHATKMINPKTDGAVLPILHLNGYRISGPTFFGTMSDDEIRDYFFGLSYEPIFVDQYKSDDIYLEFLNKLHECYEKIKALKESWDYGEKPLWPVMILRTKKGWTGPKYLRNKKIEDNNLSHGIPFSKPKTDDVEFEILKEWLESYDIGEFMNKTEGEVTSPRLPKENILSQEIFEFIPSGDLRLGKNKNTFGGDIRKPLKLPDLADHEVKSFKRGDREESRMVNFGQYTRDIFDNNTEERNFRLFSPDESESNLLESIYAETIRSYIWPIRDQDEYLSPDGRIMEMLSEHVLQEMMSGYILTGRHGVLVSYEAFLGIVTTQIEQYIKFLKQSKKFSWRKPLSSMNLIATSTVWRQEHNGFSHQNPTLINSLLTKHSDLVRVYFPSDVNTFLSTVHKCFEDTNRVNLIVACKREIPQWLYLNEAQEHVEKGLSIWHWVDSTHSDDMPDVVISSAGDYQTMECLSAIKYLNEYLPEMKIRYVNVNELTAFGIGSLSNLVDSDIELNRYFTEDRDVIFNFHGYPSVIKQLTWGNEISSRMKVLGYIEEGSTTTPFDMQVRNGTSRFHVVIEAIRSASKYNQEVKSKAEEIIKIFENKITEHQKYILENGDDMPEVKHVDFNF